MAVYSGPDIVRGGLVLQFDAANSRCYSGTGTVLTDLSGLTNVGTLNNGVAYSSDNQGGWVFDGVNDYVTVTCKLNTIRAYNSTTQMWIKLPIYTGSQRNIMSYRTGPASLYIGKASGGIFAYYNSLSPSPALTVGSISSNSIVNVAVCCDATNNLISTYINASLAGSASRTGWSTTYNTTITLGGSDIEYMLGSFYQFSHYNRVLSEAEISQNFEATRGRYVV